MRAERKGGGGGGRGDHRPVTKLESADVRHADASVEVSGPSATGDLGGGGEMEVVVICPENSMAQVQAAPLDPLHTLAAHLETSPGITVDKVVGER